MKYILFIGMLLVSLGCTNQLINSAWEISSMTMSLDEDNPAKAAILGAFIEAKLNGHRITVDKERFSISGTELNTRLRVLKITATTIVVEEDGERDEIKYESANDGSGCEFTFSNGSKFQTDRIR